MSLIICGYITLPIYALVSQVCKVYSKEAKTKHVLINTPSKAHIFFKDHIILCWEKVWIVHYGMLNLLMGNSVELLWQDNHNIPCTNRAWTHLDPKIQLIAYTKLEWCSNFHQPKCRSNIIILSLEWHHSPHLFEHERVATLDIMHFDFVPNMGIKWLVTHNALSSPLALLDSERVTS